MKRNMLLIYLLMFCIGTNILTYSSSVAPTEPDEIVAPQNDTWGVGKS